MRRLPVIATIREAYNFTFANLGAIIGLIWLPMVLLTVGDFFVSRYAAEQMAAGFENNGGLAQLIFLPMKILLYAVTLVPVTQLALGQRQGGAMIHFGFGKPEWRLFRALLGLMMLVLIAGIATVTVLGGGAPGAGPLMHPAAAQAILLLLAGATIYLQVRFASLLLPLVAMEDKTLLQTSWTLTAGNFWRLLGVVVGTLLPIFFLLAVAMMAVLRRTLDSTVVPDIAGVNAAVSANLPMVMGLEFLVAPLMIGLAVSASVFSWRALSKTDLVI